MNVTNLEMAQATIEIFGGLICVMSSVIITINGSKKKSIEILRKMFLITALIFWAEAGAYIFRGNFDSISVVMTRVCNFIVFFLNFVLLNHFIRYIYSVIEQKGVVVYRTCLKVSRFTMAFIFAVLCINLFTNSMYYFDTENYYHRNWFWYVYAIVAVLIILMGACLGVRYRKEIGKRTFHSILFYSAVPVVAVGVQTKLYGFSILNISIFASLIWVLIAYLRDWSKEEEEDQKLKDQGRKSVEMIILFVIMTICMSASIISCVGSIQRIYSENSENDSRVMAHMIDSGIDNVFLRPITVAETMSKDYTLLELIKKSGELEATDIEKKMADYLESIKTGFGYQMVFAVSEKSKAYYTYNGISKYIDIENDEHDVWYKYFVEEGKPYDLDVDTDEANHWELSVFINTEIRNDKGEFLGVCGVGVEMTELQKLLERYEKAYGIKIDLVDEHGLIQVDSQGDRIERDYLDTAFISNANSREFSVQKIDGGYQLTKYMKNLDWYLVIRENGGRELDVRTITFPSIIIFIVGILIMGLVFGIVSLQEQKVTRELEVKRKTSVTDELTGMYNRRAYEKDCKNIQLGNYTKDIIIVMMDINGLKLVNDTLGHSAGDELIMGAAKCMQTTFGKIGKIYRTGGDEFVALLHCSKDQLKEELVTFDHIIAKWKGENVKELSISKGVVVCAEHSAISFAEMEHLADKRMYVDKDLYYKKSGLNRRKI